MGRHSRRNQAVITGKDAGEVSPTTTEAIERIAALYAIEAEIRGSLAEVRKTIRQARAKPVLDSMHTRFETTLGKITLKPGHGGGDPLCPLALDSARSLCRQWTTEDRQQRRRTRVARRRARTQKELPLRWIERSIIC